MRKYGLIIVIVAFASACFAFESSWEAGKKLKYLILRGRLQEDQGTDVASATNITLGQGNYFDITGTTQINTISASNWQSGSMIALQFDDTVTVKHATAGTGAQLFLQGSADFSAATDDTVCLVYDGTYWRELSRSVN